MCIRVEAEVITIEIKVRIEKKCDIFTTTSTEKAESRKNTSVMGLFHSPVNAAEMRIDTRRPIIC